MNRGKPSNMSQTSNSLSKSVAYRPLSKSGSAKSKCLTSKTCPTSHTKSLITSQSCTHCHPNNACENFNNHSSLIQTRSPYIKQHHATEAISLASSIKCGAFSNLFSKISANLDANQIIKIEKSNANHHCYKKQPNEDYPINDEQLRPRCQSKHVSNNKCEILKEQIENDSADHKILELSNELRDKLDKGKYSDASKYNMYMLSIDHIIALSPSTSCILTQIKLGIEQYVSYLINEHQCQLQSLKTTNHALKHSISLIESKYMQIKQEYTNHSQKILKDKEMLVANYEQQISTLNQRVEQLILKYNIRTSQNDILNCKSTKCFVKVESPSSQALGTIDTKSTTNSKGKNMVPCLDLSKLRKKPEELKLIVRPTDHDSLDSSVSNAKEPTYSKKPIVPKLDLKFMRDLRMKLH